MENSKQMDDGNMPSNASKDPDSAVKYNVRTLASQPWLWEFLIRSQIDDYWAASLIFNH